MTMRTGLVSIFLCFALSLSGPVSAEQLRSLGFEDRVRAQEAIERVYFDHQVGVTRSFDQVVPRELLERKVRTYLEQSEALERLWGTPITSEALRREWDRIVRQTRYPDRLREIAEALGWDPLLLFECLARPTLVNRLVGDFYAYDDRLHAEMRSETERVRELLIEGDFEAAASSARLHQVHLKRANGVSTSSRNSLIRSTPADPTRAEVLELDAGTYRARRGRAPKSVGQVGAIIEHDSAFEIRMVLEGGVDHARIASYFVPKLDRDAWWKATRGSFDGGFVPPPIELTAEELRMAAEGALGLEGAFDPSCLPDDTWDDGILEDLNPARDGHSAVWTGTEMIIWGGGGLDSGLRYDPLLDEFTPMSRENAPSRRSYHTAVWNGGEMIVWGGWPLSTTGGRYDPVRDSWTPIATHNAPEARFDAPSARGASSSRCNTLGVVGQLSRLRQSPSPSASSSGSPMQGSHPSTVPVGVVGRTAGTGERHTAVSTDDVGLGTGEGLFAPEVVYPVGPSPVSITAGDFDGDGFDDLATANAQYPGNVTELLNSGDGSFGQTTTWASDEEPVFIRAADLNDDGISDLVVVNPKWEFLTPAPGSLSVFLGTGDGFEPRTDHRTGFRPQSAAIADLSGDGNLDVVVANLESQTFSYHLGSPSGNLGAALFFAIPGGRSPELIVTGDFNNDQIPDIALSVVDSSLFHVYLGVDGFSFLFVGEGSIGGGRKIASLSVGDFDEDNTQDLVMTHTDESDGDLRVLILTGDGTGDFVFGGEVPAGSGDPYPGGKLAVGDFNWDGNDDIVMANTDDFDISILTGDGNLGFDAEVRIPVGVKPRAVTIGDLTGDGRHSIGVVNYNGDTVSVLLNQGPVGNRPPIADAGPEYWHFWADSPEGATMQLNGSGSTDPDSTPGTADDIVLYEWIEDLGLPTQNLLGVGKTLDVFLPNFVHDIALRTTDTMGSSDIDHVGVFVVPLIWQYDLTLEFNPPSLWPPNHRLVEMQVSVVPGPTCTNPTVLLTGVSSSQLADAPGTADGKTAVDILDASLLTPDLTFSLRAERSALTPGRSYYVTYNMSCGSTSLRQRLYWFMVPFEQNGTAEPLQILLDETGAGTLVSWAPVAGAQDYDVIRGSLDNLQVLGDTYDLGDVTCIEANSTDESTAGFEDPTEPLPNEVFFYLVQYQKEGDSGYGTESAAKPRIPGGGDCL